MPISTNETLVGDFRGSIVLGLSQYVSYAKEHIQGSCHVTGSGMHDAGDNKVVTTLKTWSNLIYDDAKKITSIHLALSEADSKMKANLMGLKN